MTKPLPQAQLLAVEDAAQEYSIVDGLPVAITKNLPWVLVRCKSGVIVGQLVKIYPGAATALLVNSCRIWSWVGLSQEVTELALNGCGPNSRITLTNPGQRVLTECADIIQVSEKALPSLTTARWP
jgi:hypothetical protein